MLVVIAILGILAALIVPALKNISHSNAAISASRQLLDDVARARQLAISHRMTVYMVFVPANFWTPTWMDVNGQNPTAAWNNLTPAQKTAVTNLCDKQLTGYTFVSLRTVGDQPGQHNWHYLAPWQTLPDGTFIVTNKFEIAPFDAPKRKADYPSSSDVTNFVTMNVPFPTEDSPSILMPCVEFDYRGQLVSGRNEYIPLARGNMSPAWDPETKAYRLNPPQVLEVPPGNSTNAYNIIDIEPLTGRATLQQPKMQ